MNLPFERHLLICTGPRCGNERNSNRIRQEFRREFVRQSVPASVKETIAKVLPGSTIRDATKKTALKKVFYELDITGANRSHILWTVGAM